MHIAAFQRLGRWVSAHARSVLIAWIIALALGAAGESRLSGVLLGGLNGVPGSGSTAAGDVLRREFDSPFLDPLVVAVATPGLSVDADDLQHWLRDTARRLQALRAVARVRTFADASDSRLRSPDGHRTLLIIALASRELRARAEAVTIVRAALAPARAALLQLDPAARLAVTGGPAVDVDINAWSAAGGDRASMRALPLTLGVLILAFSTLIAAGLPFLMGLTTTTVALGLAYGLARLVPVSNLLGNVVTMIGLAVGIDYSLLVVTHFREQAQATGRVGAVAATVASAGRTIAWSGLTVMIGLLGLLFSPILETRCVGIGGALVVCVSVLAALTLLPATLVLLGPWIDRWPLMPRRLHPLNHPAFWHRLGSGIVRRPLPVLLASGALVLALALPLAWGRSGFTNEPWFLARGMESRVGAELLNGVRSDNAGLPIHAIVRATDGQPLLAPGHLAALTDYAARLAAEPRIAQVESPLALRQQPQLAGALLSRDRTAALFELTPADGLAVRDIERLARELRTLRPAGPFEVRIGGTAAEQADFSDAMWRSFPWVFGFVLGATLLLLFCAFRSWLLPVAAVLTNLCAVAAGYGVVTAIFQHGWLTGLVGLERPFAAIPLEVPLMVFCLSFGLSMDYELFLLFRIQQEYALDGDNDRATVEGLAAVAPVITGAGLIMAAVFGAFIGAELPVLKMIGVGLCVSVLVDATLIRAFVVPSAMALAGRWNWYPGGAGRGGPARLAVQ